MIKSTVKASCTSPVKVTVNTATPSSSFTLTSSIDTLTTSSDVSVIVPNPWLSAIVADPVVPILLKSTVKVSVGSENVSSVIVTEIVIVVPLTDPAGNVTVPLAVS